MVVSERRCDHCGYELGNRWIDVDCRSFCLKHAEAPRCSFCAAPSSRTGLGWSYCRQCDRNTVTDGVRLEQYGRPVVEFFSRRGYPIGSKTILTLKHTSSSGELSGELGRTVIRRRILSNSATSVFVEVLSGLPLVVFQATVAHEYGHALMATRGLLGYSSIVEEGVSEFLSFVFLKTTLKDDCFAKEYRARMMQRGDEYGIGLRLIRAHFKVYGEAVFRESFVERSFERFGISRT